MYKKIIGILICSLYIGTSIIIIPNILIKNVRADFGILFSDDFNDGNNNGWFVYQGDWQVISGQYVYNYNGISEIDGITIADTDIFSDIIYTGKLMVTEGTPQVHFIFRFGGYNGYNCYSGYSFLYDIGMDDRWGLYKFYLSGSYTKIASESSSSSLNFDQWYNLKIETTGSHIKCYVNNELKIDTYDSTYLTGKIGFRGDISKIYYDDIVVSNSENNNPYVPYNPSPTNHLTNVDINAEISWTCSDPDGDQLTYDVYFGTNNPPTSIVSTGQTGNSYKPSTMNYLINYYWKIVAKDSQGANSTSPIWDFTTTDQPNNPPIKPSKPFGPTAGWAGLLIDFKTTATDPDNDQIKYGWDWDGNDIIDQWTELKASNISCTITHIWDNCGIYEIKVKVKDSKGAVSGWSEIKTIQILTKNQPPNIPNEPYPSNHATGIDIKTDLYWIGGDPDIDDSFTYDIYFGTNSSPQLVRSNYPNNTYEIGTKIINTKYYWKIVAEDEHGETTTGPIWDFTTLIKENQTPIVDIISPKENDYVSGFVNIYGSASDPDGNNTLTKVEINIDNNNWNTVTGIEYWNYSWNTNEESNGNHTIYVRSYDGEIYSNLSIVNVTVINANPEIIIDGITGVIGIKADITNIGITSANIVNWSIDVKADFGIILSGKHTEDVITELGVNEQKEIKSLNLRGIGLITITVQAANTVKKATGFLLGPLVLRVNEI